MKFLGRENSLYRPHYFVVVDKKLLEKFSNELVTEACGGVGY